MMENNTNSKTNTNNKGTDPIPQQIGGFSVGGVISWIGRLMIASLFIIGGILAAMNFRTFAQTIQQLRLPAPTILAILAILGKIVGGILFTGLIPIPFGMSIGRFTLLIFTALATYFMHNPVKNPGEMQNFLKNIAIMGGLLVA